MPPEPRRRCALPGRVGPLSKWLAQRRKLACCAAGEGLSGLLAAAGAEGVGFAGCPGLPNLGQLLRAARHLAAALMAPTKTKLWSREASLEGAVCGGPVLC